MRRLTGMILTGALLLGSACDRLQRATSSNPPGSPGAPAQPGGGVAGEAIPELPDYPNASRVSYSSEVTSTRIMKAEFVTADTIEQVKAYYAAVVKDGGWEVTQYEEKPGKVEWDLAKGTSTAEIDIDQEATGGVQVKLESRDR